MPYLNTNLLPFDKLDAFDSINLPSKLERAAAVLIAITDHSSKPEILYTRRADHLSSHSGQVSFPGGRWEVEDTSLLHTALRESDEEVALEPNKVDFKGCLKTKVSANRLDVFPFVGVIPAGTKLTPNPDEIADIFHVPLSFFIEQPPSRIDLLNRGKVMARIPAWDYCGYNIWGLTAMFTYDLLCRFNIDIDLTHIPERRFD